jgi:hypothetical protein
MIYDMLHENDDTNKQIYQQKIYEEGLDDYENDNVYITNLDTDDNYNYTDDNKNNQYIDDEMDSG